MKQVMFVSDIINRLKSAKPDRLTKFVDDNGKPYTSGELLEAMEELHAQGKVVFISVEEQGQ